MIKYVKWEDSLVKLTWSAGNDLPPRDLITSVHGFCFQDNKLLLVKLDNRGWDFPGGHIEEGESPEQCIHREAYEEGYVTGTITLLGKIIVDHSENVNWDPSSPYPKVGYQLFYRMDIDQIHHFKANYESSERIFINPNKVEEYYTHWNELYDEILDYALKK
ncbi:NUDIX hydrolase [Ornithinibacillus halotolerans]|uniref:Nudix hydrolase domain-containing protein n=1 Tax=Ornithinibacillus halotolerans TaxID=1274357 RepID=A0A916WCU5_9BACI|nr:NUDIX domain-containing protein [Ornithinibacillus halotolerans]GGA89353.1 hypothetical protein GCM10008025_34980 [Ornithinibacillus halotolerans]